MRNKGGLYYPNGDVSPADINIALNLGFSNLTFLHMQRGIAKRWREKYPEGIINCRFYLPNWRAQGPAAWAALCAETYLRRENKTSLKELGVHVTPSNEMNLADEGGGWTEQDYVDINAWCSIWYDEFTRLTNIPNEWTHFPAFAFGHSDDQNDFGYIGAEICRPSIEKYFYINCHPYFAADTIKDRYYGHRFILTHNLFPDKKIFLDEAGYLSPEYDITNPIAHIEIEQHFLSLYDFDYVDGVTYFIFRDPTLHHVRNDWGRNRKVEQYLTGIVKPEVVVFERGFLEFSNVLKAKGISPGRPLESETPIVGPDDYMMMRQRTTTGTFYWNKEYNDMLMWTNAKKIIAYNGGDIRIA